MNFGKLDPSLVPLIELTSSLPKYHCRVLRLLLPSWEAVIEGPVFRKEPSGTLGSFSRVHLVRRLVKCHFV
jgi:hypothetical protein